MLEQTLDEQQQDQQQPGPGPKYKVTPKVLADFSATMTAKPNLTEQEIFSKFPEFKNDKGFLKSALDYNATSKSGKYKTAEELNSKFPELEFEVEQKKSFGGDGSFSKIGQIPTKVLPQPVTPSKPVPVDLELKQGFENVRKEQASKENAKNSVVRQYEIAQETYAKADKNAADGKLNDMDIPKADNFFDNAINSVLEEISPRRKYDRIAKEKEININVNTKEVAAQQALKGLLPILEEVSKESGEIYTSLTRLNADGEEVSDPYKINEYAAKKAKEAGVAEGGYYYKLVYNEAKAAVEHKIIEPTVNAKFEQLFKKKYGVTVEQKLEADFKGNFKQGAAIEAEVKSKAGLVASEIEADSKNKLTVVQEEITVKSNAVNEAIKLASDNLQQQFGGMIKDGKFSGTAEEFQMYQQGFKEIEKLSEGAKQQSVQWGKDFLNQQNIINTKANARYRRQVSEIYKVAEMQYKNAADKYAALYKANPQIKADIESFYKTAYSETIGQIQGYKNLYSQFSSPATNFLKSMVTSFGGSIKGLSTTLGINQGAVLGDYLENSFTHGSAEIKEAKDLIDPTKLSLSSGQLVGGMAPGIAAAAGTVALTRGMGGNAAFQLLTSGAASWLSESADIAGRMEADILAETKDATKARNAAEEVWKGQIAIAPVYALDGLPFLGKTIKLGKNIATRAVLGGVVELATETVQEYPQNLMDEAIRKGEQFSDALKYHSLEKLENTLLNIAPVAILGAGGQIKGAISEERVKEKAIKAYAQKTKFGELSSTQKDQFVFDMAKTKGQNFSSAVLMQMYSSGAATKEEFNDMTKSLATSIEIINRAKELSLNDGEQKVFTALTFNYDKAKKNFESQTDPILKSSAEAIMKEAEKQVTSYSATKKANYAVVTYADNSQFLFSHDEITNSLQNKEFAEEIKNGTIQVSVFGQADQINSSLDALKKPADNSTSAAAPAVDPAGTEVSTEAGAAAAKLEPQQMTVAQLRAEEQKEYDAIGANGDITTPVIEAKKKEIFDRYNALITPKLEEEKAAKAQTAEGSVEGEVKLEKGNKIQWNVFGNEESGEWTISEKTKTRGGKDAVVLAKIYVESSSDGKSYTKEFADANGIKYDNERTVEHTVPLEDLKTLSTQQENNGSTTTATNQPVSTTEGTTQQQGGQEAVQQGTNDAGSGGAASTPAVQPAVKEEVSVSPEAKQKELETQRDADIAEAEKPQKPDLEFIDNTDAKLKKPTGREITVVSKKGRTTTKAETFLDTQNDIKKRKSILESIIKDCL